MAQGTLVQVREDGSYLGARGRVLEVHEGWHVRVQILECERFPRIVGDAAWFSVENLV